VAASLAFLLHNRAICTAVCRSCPHRAPLDLLPLAVSYEEQTRIDAIERAMRCSACGEKNVEIMVDAGQHGPVTEPE
jgi:hypothetical protein